MFFYWDMINVPSKRVSSQEQDMNIIIEYHNVLDQEIYNRVKDYQYYIRKIVIQLIIIGFMIYESLSFIYEGREYF